MDPETVMRRHDIAAERVAALGGVLHATSAALVEVMHQSLSERLWEGWGIHSPEQWLSWRSGLSKRQCRHVILVAGRADELPTALAALRAGELSLDQVRVIAAHVPARYEAAAVDLAKVLTVSQLERKLPHYCFDADPDEVGDPRAETPSSDGSTSGDPTDGDPRPSAQDEAADRAEGATQDDAESRAEGCSDQEPPGSVGGPSPIDEQRRAGFWFDDRANGHLTATLPTDEALVLQAALDAARSDLLARLRAELGPDAKLPEVTTADALVALAQNHLDVGAAARPGAGRYRIHAHLNFGPSGRLVLTSHLGPVVPDHLRRLLTCDADLVPVLEDDGRLVALGRTQRSVPERLRRLIEHRDGGCVVPGCGRRSNLHLHHIHHWEDGGTTDPANVVTLCIRHHRLHHLGFLPITGNPELHGPGGLVIEDRWGRRLEPSPMVEPPPDPEPANAAVAIGIEHDPYPVPTSEPVRDADIHLAPNPSRAGPTAA